MLHTWIVIHTNGKQTGLAHIGQAYTKNQGK